MPSWFPPVEPDYGADCPNCYPAALTPSAFGISLSGIMRGDLWIPADGAPPNGTFFFQQVPGTPCAWIDPDAVPLHWEYLLGPAQSELLIEVANFVFAFYGIEVIPCQSFFNNWYAVPAGNHFYGGTAQIMTAWEAQGWIEIITPVVDPDPLLQVVSMPNDRAVISYIDRWGDTKIKMLIDRSP